MENSENNSDQNRTTFIYILFLAMAVFIALIFYMRSQVRKPTQYEQEINQIVTQSESDNIEDIEKDLENTDLEDIDRELNDIEAELNQSY